MSTATNSTTSRWSALAESVLGGDHASADEAQAVLDAPELELLDVLSAAYRVRHHYFGNTVKLNYLINAKSGICPEDCHYCSQSRVSTAEIDRYSLLDSHEIAARAERAVELRASTCCIVTAARRPSARELREVSEAVRQVKKRHPALKICACMGLLDDDEAETLRAAGVDRYNHNLNTAESHYGEICTTHTYTDRVETVGAVARSGISPCSGVIVGMGESRDELVRVALELRTLAVDSIPVNFLIPIEGTPLEGSQAKIDPRFALRVLAMFRFVCPDREIRMSAGREIHLGTLQPLGLYPANAIFVADYLTEQGQAPEEDWRMIEELGFTIEPIGGPLGPVPSAETDVVSEPSAV